MKLMLARSLALFVAAAGVLPAVASASSLTLINSVDSTSAATVAPGMLFSVALRLTADTAFLGYSVFLTDPAYVSGASSFSIGSRTSLPSNPFTDAQTADAALIGDPIDNLSRDLGYSASAGPATAGTYDTQTLSINSLPTLAPGVYQITFNANSVLVSDAGDEVGFTVAPFTVTVVPEPASLAVLGLGSMLLLRRRK